MSDSPPNCPSCRAPQTHVIGPIPATDLFSGRMLDAPLPGGCLYRCAQCRLQFRHPTLSKRELDALYKIGVDDQWQADFSGRADWNIAAGWIRQHLISGSVLDVGCFDGSFLSGLEGPYDRFGIEIHPVASEVARSRGISIVGTDWVVAADETGPPFDVIAAFDVIEHVEDPSAFVRVLSRRLSPGGLLILSSGNTEAASWRFLGSRYWYCTIAEHISFISAYWCEYVARECGLSPVMMETFSHGRRTFLNACTAVGKNAAYKWFPSLSSRLRKSGFGKKSISADGKLSDHPPSWIVAKDHLIVALRK